MWERVKRATRESGCEPLRKALAAGVADASDTLEDLVLSCQMACLDGTHIVAQVRKEANGLVLSVSWVCRDREEQVVNEANLGGLFQQPLLIKDK